MAITSLVLIAPIPLGSNRPIPWMVWTFLLALMLLIYVSVHSLKTPNSPLRSHAIWQVFAIGATFLGFLVLQSFNIGALYKTSSHNYISITPAASALGAVRISGYAILLFLTMETAAHPQRIKKIGWTIFIGVAAHAAWSMAALKLLGDISVLGQKTAYLGYATGTFINRNSFATFLGMGFVLGLTLLLDKSHKRLSLDPAHSIGIALMWMCLAMIAIALVSTQSRMGFFATGVGASVVVFLSKPQKKSLLFLASLLILAMIFSSGLAERTSLILSDSNGRVELWRQTIELIRTRPYLGFGFDSFAPAFALQHQPPLPSDVVWEYAHNTYLTLWVETGIFFGSLPLLALLWIGIKLARSRRPHPPMAVVAIAVLALTAAHSLVDFSLEMQANALLFTLLLGLGLASVCPKNGQLKEGQSA